SGFTRDAQDLLQAVLRSRFDIETSVHRTGSGYQLYVRSRSFVRFCDLISPHIVAPMRYKLPVDPVTTSPPRRRDSDFARESEPNYGRYDTSALIRPMR